MTENTTRPRNKSEKTKSTPENVEYRKKEHEFVIRVSPLTEMIENSQHIKAIYHIFVAILLMLLLDTVIYDLIEKGK